LPPDAEAELPVNDPVIPVCAVVLVIGVIALLKCDRKDIADVVRALFGRKLEPGRLLLEAARPRGHAAQDDEHGQEAREPP
jgi:hypothetical protein